MLKATTRHIHIFGAVIDNADTFITSDSKLTLDVDPDNEFIWNETALQKVFSHFDRLLSDYNGLDYTEYNLRRVGSDMENFLRTLLEAGEISYNLDGRTLNYSMGKPLVSGEDSNWRMRDR